jgi:hypothetical protein
LIPLILSSSNATVSNDIAGFCSLDCHLMGIVGIVMRSMEMQVMLAALVQGSG